VAVAVVKLVVVVVPVVTDHPLLGNHQVVVLQPNPL
jgi:hypothetical protein